MAEQKQGLKRALQSTQPGRAIVIWSMVVALLLSGAAFAYKVAEFMFTMTTAEFAGSFDVPVLVYFSVATGWLLLLVWCLMTGAFKNMEQGKGELLKQEEEYERLGI